MRLLVHSPKFKGGKRKKHATIRGATEQQKEMGNAESSCLKGTEPRKTDALEAPAPVGHKSESYHRRTWHGHHQKSSTSTAASSESNSKSRSHYHFPSPRLRGKTWHGLRRSHHSDRSHATEDHHIPSRRNKGAMRRKSGEALHKISHAVSQFFHGFEEFFFPRNPILQRQTTKPHHQQAPPRVRGGVLLHGCESPEEHFKRIRAVLELVRDLHGAEGLKAIGLEYRIVACDEHKAGSVAVGCREISEEAEEQEAAFAALAALRRGTRASSSQPDLQLCSEITDSLRSNDGSYYESVAADTLAGRDQPLQTIDDDYNNMFCNICKRRLYHIESNTLIEDNNRKQFIADGDMYEAVSRLAQEHAQDVMIQEGGLEWVTIEDEDGGSEPIRALINSDHPLFGNNESDRPTVMICTGRGKVRAGIFSRQHLICIGLETATAVPLVREAVTRHLNVVIVDPNVRGEAQGFATFQKTMDYLGERYFGEENCSEGLSCRNMFVLSHSASGGHMARYFLNKPHSAFLQNIRAVAFTDSTHSIQWAKSNDKKQLFDMLQSKQCVYFRCAREGDGVAGDGNKWYLHPAGEEIQTDSFWKHRFGNIRTMWAGTNEHSLTNWYAHAKIWEHFDHFLLEANCPDT